MSDTVTVSLSKSVMHGDQTFTELTFREPTVGDLILGDQIGTGQLARMSAILASISDIPLPAFKKIGAKDFSKIVDATSELLGNDTKKKKPTTGD
ncbi:phage tail assembly protein [Agrobacterium cavarae]|uniref:Phage tail assembly protein n=1 Tax=Agrobacterium cavarae TaxID=2528239 RepID=A0ABY1Y7A4_9HYPH|nr:phage tail assembly protein [Agrobacterium cavarae]TBN10876.1 phage tail assembly protein [Agrobacterium cavarae]